MKKQKQTQLTPLILEFSNKPAKKYNLTEEMGEKIYREYWSQIFKELGTFENACVKIDGFGSFLTTLKKVKRLNNTYYKKVLKRELEVLEGISFTTGTDSYLDNLASKVESLDKLAVKIQERINYMSNLRDHKRELNGYKKPKKIKAIDKIKKITNDNPFE